MVNLRRLINDKKELLVHLNDRDELVNSIQLKNRFIGRLNPEHPFF